QSELSATAGRIVRHRKQACGVSSVLQQRGSGIQYGNPAVSRFAVCQNLRLPAADLLRSWRGTGAARTGAERQVLTSVIPGAATLRTRFLFARAPCTGT